MDWSIVAPNSNCQDLTKVLQSNLNICSFDKEESKKTFCDTFDQCVIWKGTGTDDDIENFDDDPLSIDCDSLSKCEWEGYKPSYIGDGICHDFIDGCYNSAICNYDGGDCCPDTCRNATVGPGCGSDGYFCKDPSSKNFVNNSTNGNDTPVIPSKANCTADETPYKLFMYDSFGDGWDKTEMMIAHRDDPTQSPFFDGRLEQGSEGMEFICLSNAPDCYSVKVFGGFWGNEVSWEIKPMKNGAPSIASGGSPMDCEFAISGAPHCDNTCNGKPNVDPETDEKYHSYHQMVNCIEDNCKLQLAMCKNDLVCASCVEAQAPSYCLASDIYNALGFCTECNCVKDIDEEEKQKFCKDKSREKHENEDDNGQEEKEDVHPDDNSSQRMRACSFDEFTAGSNAVIAYSECSHVDYLSSLLIDFDPDNFGALDAFESCAAEYSKNKYHKSNTPALDCFHILENAIKNPGSGVDPKKNPPLEAISNMANDLLNNGEDFCECTVAATTNAPVCRDFKRFKTLLYESNDACKALDAIDCAAWAEYYPLCEGNMIDKFKKVDFRKTKQCAYAKENCGTNFPFPSFRRLDCDQEIDEKAWDFYLDYERNCLRDGPLPPKPQPPNRPPPKPVPVPVPAPTKRNTPAPTKKSYVPPEDKNKPTSGGKKSVPVPSNNDGKKKYVPPEQRGKKSGHFFRNFFIMCGLGYGVYWYFKNVWSEGYSLREYLSSRFGGMNFSRFRRNRNYGADQTGMYDSLTLQNADASFQPPSLPPPPSVYDYGNGGGGGGGYVYPNNNNFGS
jgi:hypothetical protein